MTVEPHNEERLEDVAAGWVARQRSGLMSAEEAQALQQWLAADPAHREMYDHVEGLWRASAGLRTDPRIMALRDEAMAAWPQRRRPWLPFAAAAAFAVALLGGWEAISPQTAPSPALIGLPQEQVFSTGVGQTANVTLSDGSIVTLDTDSRVRAREASGRRLVWLDRGQAFFKVAHDASRPFVVSAGGRTITALGTAFNVRLDRGRVEVVLAEGRVKVEGPPPSIFSPAPKRPPVAELAPGSRLTAGEAQNWQIAKVDVDTATSWRKGQLVFVRRPLGDVADELNRYSEKKIIVRDETLARAPITGGFTEGDVDGFVRAVEGYGLATVASNNDGAVVLQARE